ncbi:hypothetical protein [Nocardia africana]
MNFDTFQNAADGGPVALEQFDLVSDGEYVVGSADNNRVGAKADPKHVIDPEFAHSRCPAFPDK